MPYSRRGTVGDDQSLCVCGDISVAAVALVLLSPLLCRIAIGVKAELAGSASIERVEGRGGTLLHLYKFRTMYVSPAGPAITRQNDPRVTSFGRCCDVPSG
jgi:lipopolysaccharide/colanic/teichoic acid biosynthesis glycosyltransferase